MKIKIIKQVYTDLSDIVVVITPSHVLLLLITWGQYVLQKYHNFF